MKKTEKEDVTVEDNPKETVKSDTLEDGVMRNDEGKITLSNLYYTNTKENWRNSNDLTDQEKGELSLAADILAQGRSSNSLVGQGENLSSADGAQPLTSKEIVDNLVSNYKNIADKYQSNGNLTGAKSYNNRANIIAKDYERIDALDGQKGNLSIEDYIKQSSSLLSNEKSSLQSAANFNTDENFDNLKLKLYASTWSSHTSGGSNKSVNFDDYDNLSYENIKQIESFFTTNKDGTTSVDLKGLHDYLESIHGVPQEINSLNGGKEFVTPAIESIGDTEISGRVLITNDNKIHVMDAGKNYVLPDEIVKGIQDGKYTFWSQSDSKYMPSETLKEAMSEEKKQDIKTGVQLFMSALSALAMTIFPMICGAALGGVIGMAVIGTTAAINTGISGVRTAKLAHRASVLRRDEMMKELLKGNSEER